MKRYGLIAVLGVSLAAVGCGDDDDSGGGGPASDKTLAALTGAELEDLCDDLLGTVRSVSTPVVQCTSDALEEVETRAECDDQVDECVAEELYEDFDAVQCKNFRGGGDEFDCDRTVGDVKQCYDRTASWLRGLKCSQAGDAPEQPACVDDLIDDCGLGLSTLLEASDDAPDAGGMSCEPGDLMACSCSGGGSGLQTCSSRGEYGDCECATSFECSVGSQSYPYDLGSDACNACAVASCCDSFVDCQNDDACECYWECLNKGDDDCDVQCDLPAEYPPEFTEHASCLSTACETPCELGP